MVMDSPCILHHWQHNASLRDILWILWWFYCCCYYFPNLSLFSSPVAMAIILHIHPLWGCDLFSFFIEIWRATVHQSIAPLVWEEMTPWHTAYNFAHQQEIWTFLINFLHWKKCRLSASLKSKHNNVVVGYKCLFILPIIKLLPSRTLTQSTVEFTEFNFWVFNNKRLADKQFKHITLLYT